ncbi:MAG: hypothetical protein LJE85_05075 [Gammaproteobacteria bacterium]|nr:hypothetical protein [Gammaproteobacteria bacterium]
MLGLFSKKSGLHAVTEEALEFNFELPVYRQPENKLPDVTPLWSQLDALAAEPVHLLVELNHFLHELNRTYLQSDRRYDITARCLEYAAPAFRYVYFEHQKGKALPEISSKREALIAAVTCVKELANSFKRIIKNEYKPGGKKIKSPNRRVRQCMLAVLEMVYAEQRLKALRYQKLNSLAWRDCNNLFVILQSTGDVRKAFKPTGLITSRSSPSESMAKAMKTNAEELYAAIQLLGLIDPNTLSLQQIVIVESYLKQYLPELHFHALNEEKLPVNCIITSYGHDGPPLLQEAAEYSPHALSMDIQSLLSGIKQDYQPLLAQVNGSAKNFGPEPAGEIAAKASTVNSLEDVERLLALRAMLKKLRETERTDTRKYAEEAQDWYVYNGFTAGFRMLNGSRGQTDGVNRLQNQLNISLAQRSASLADSGADENVTQWEIVNESAGGVLLRTKETQFINNLFIGQLIVFARSKSDLNQPSCGWVVRIRRAHDNQVELSLKLLASHIESVVVQTEILKKNTMGMPGIMILDAGEDLQLLMHQSHRLMQGSSVSIQRGGKSYTSIVGEILFFQREFVLYRLT